MTVTIDDLATKTEQPVRRDRWGRYLVSVDGRLEGYTRATTVAKSLDDQQALIDWAARMTAIGLSRRPDLVALASTTDPDDRTALNGIVDRAKEAGGATARRDLGTAIHAMLERKIGDPGWVVPAPYAADVAAILEVLAAHRLRVTPAGTEQMVVDDNRRIAGTCDLIVERGGVTYVADLKTGASVTYGALGFAIQLAAYAHATAIYRQGAAADGSEDRRDPMPDVAKNVAFIVHCEPGSGLAALYELDIAAGVEALDLALAVRLWRSRKGLLTRTEPAPPPLPAVEHMHHRYDAVRDLPGGLPVLRVGWTIHAEGVPPGKRWREWTVEQLPAIEAAIMHAEKEVSAPFYPPLDPPDPPEPAPLVTVTRPPAKPDDGPLEPEMAAALIVRVKALPADHRELVNRWAKEAASSGWSVSVTQSPCRRRCEIVRAILALAGDSDSVARALLTVVLGDDTVQPTSTTGHLLGALTITQAQQLWTIAQ